jgi:hypothetical protein
MQPLLTETRFRASSRGVETALRPTVVRPTGVPIAILEALLRDHLGEQAAVITAYTSTPLDHQGTNDSNTFFRVTFSWALPNSALDARTSTWIIKHWKAGGVRDSALGITQPREILAWERGWLQPRRLPDSVVVPFTSAWRAPDDSEAWLAMADVSTELSAYPRMGLAGEQVLSRAQTILARLAQFHAMWEQPQRQAELHASAWLQRPEGHEWEIAPTDGLSANLDAFLAGRPDDERRLWEHLLLGRHTLMESLAAYPQTLLHNDLDDRNIGLRWPSGGAVTESAALDRSDLILIDWEWIAVGTAALDVASIIQRLPVMLTPGSAIPAAFWTNELADYYFEHYRAAGGECADVAEWRRSYGLALVARGVAQMPFIHGSMRRAIRGEIPPPQIVGVPEAVIRRNLRAGLPMMEQMEQLVIREARRWLE